MDSKKDEIKTILKPKEIIAQETIVELKNLLNKNNWGIVKIDKYGNFSFDMGSASAGRVSGNLKDVTISIEHSPERPGCADVCPPMEIIHFKCINGKKCVTDTADSKLYGYLNQGVITFQNLKNGKKTYKLLSIIQENL